MTTLNPREYKRCLGRRRRCCANSGGSSNGIPEAPNNGKQYGRQSKNWTEILSGPGGGVPEAPDDGKKYARQSKDWSIVTDGAEGPSGVDGKSAFESALTGGFTGTETEFNTYLSSIGDIGAVLDAVNGEVI